MRCLPALPGVVTQTHTQRRAANLSRTESLQDVFRVGRTRHFDDRFETAVLLSELPRDEKRQAQGTAKRQDKIGGLW
jgi:hypothetical protein